MTPLWTPEELRAATGGRLDAEVAVSGISIDTRTIQPGDLFVALRDARDGHDFVADALAKGASCALVDRDPPGVAADAPLLIASIRLPLVRGRDWPVDPAVSDVSVSGCSTLAISSPAGAEITDAVSRCPASMPKLT